MEIPGRQEIIDQRWQARYARREGLGDAIAELGTAATELFVARPELVSVQEVRGTTRTEYDSTLGNRLTVFRLEQPGHTTLSITIDSVGPDKYSSILNIGYDAVGAGQVTEAKCYSGGLLKSVRPAGIVNFVRSMTSVIIESHS